MDLFDRPQERILQIAESVRARRPEALGRDRAARHVLLGVAEELGEGAILVQIPRNLDNFAYVPLIVARQCGAELVREVAERLTRKPGTELEPLSHAISERHLLVEGIDELRRPSTTWDVRELFEPATQPMRNWLERHAAVLTRQNATYVGHKPEEPRPDSRWASDLLWQRTERDSNRYALAVARHLLLGPPNDTYSLGWDVESLVLDLWNGMPSELRDLVALLAAHHRPILRDDFERLGLVQSAVIATAIDTFVVEQRRNQLGLPAPWYTMFASVEPEAKQHHRTLADAFARRAREDSNSADAPLAILEAHRHYALIPDWQQARELARFGVGALLGAAVTQSIAQRYPDAVKTYDTVLELARGEQSLGPVIDDKTRAYAIHYRHYNQYRVDTGTLREALIGYESSLQLWPENALFWSRLIHGCFLIEEEERALQALSHAWKAVPPHSERERTLVVHTVDRLLRDQLVLPALFVWGDTHSDVPADQIVERRLTQRLASGIRIGRLWAPGVTAITSLQPIVLRSEPVDDAAGFRSVVGERTTHGINRVEAVTRMIRRLAFETLADEWHRKTAHLSVLSVRFKYPSYQSILSASYAVRTNRSKKASSK